MARKRVKNFGAKKGTAKPKKAKGQSYKKAKGIPKVKTKAETINRNIDNRPHKIAIAKATKSHTEIDTNRDIDEAATSDVEEIPQ
jgi:hypothetical protein